MTAQDYIQTKLDELSAPPAHSDKLEGEALEAEIFRLLCSKKFRKYANTEQFNEHAKNAIHLAVSTNQPLNLVFVHGCYKLWRLQEAPEVDWAELFSMMHYTNWMKPICDMYEPGVWFDSFVDDLILPRINNLPFEQMQAYRKSYEQMLDFLKQYQPKNFRMTITGVGEQFATPEDFYTKLDSDVEEYRKEIPGGLPELTDKQKISIDLNAQPTSEQQADPLWREKITLVHDAYLAKTKFGTGYANTPDKIKVFTQPLGSGMFIAVGSSKDSVAKFWAGVGALKPRDGSYRPLVLTPSQLAGANVEWEDVSFPGLTGKNFDRIRIVE